MVCLKCRTHRVNVPTQVIGDESVRLQMLPASKIVFPTIQAERHNIADSKMRNTIADTTTACA